MSMDEKRFFSLKDSPLCVEERALGGGGTQAVIKGLAIAYNSPSHPLYENGKRFIETIAPTALSKTLSDGGKSVRAYFNHDSDRVIGSVKSGSLKLSPTERGLEVEITPPNTSWGKDAVEAVRAGLCEGFSFGFNVIKDSWEKGGAGELPTRTLKEIRLAEVSPVYSPAYPGTDVALRSLMDAETSKEIDGYFEPEKKEEERKEEPTTKADDEAGHKPTLTNLSRHSRSFLIPAGSKKNYRRFV